MAQCKGDDGKWLSAEGEDGQWLNAKRMGSGSMQRGWVVARCKEDGLSAEVIEKE